MTPNVRGAIAMSMAMLCFVLNDLAIKGVLKDLPTGQAMFLRGLFAIVFATALAWRSGAFRHARLLLNRMVLLRCVLEGCAASCFLTALAFVPFATLSATLQMTPLIATGLAALTLREQVGWRRWAAMGAGLVGMLIILQPGVEEISIYALLGVATSFLAAARDIATRVAPPETPTMLFAFGSVITIMVAGAAMSVVEANLGRPWATADNEHLALLVIASIIVIGANFFVSKAMRLGEVSFVAPFRYTSVLFATLGAWIVFLEEPGLNVLVGAGVIIAAGLYTFHREQVRGRDIATRPQPPQSR
ncbi:MAG: DMT family transporter [Neomegalonema sp.]